MTGTRASGFGQGPAKGAAVNRKSKTKLDTSPEKQRERRGRPRKPQILTDLDRRAAEIVAETGCGFVRAKQRAWREAHPDHVDEEPISRAEIAEVAQLSLGPAVRNLVTRLHRTKSDSAAANIANVLRELAHGKDSQAIQLSGADGGPIEIKGYAVAPEQAKTMDQWTAIAAAVPEAE